MATFTLAQLRTEVRRRADMETSQFIKDAELTSYINTSIAELYDLLVQKFGNDYFFNSYSFSLVPGTESYNLPADFFKLLAVDIQLANGEYNTVKRFELNERNKYNSTVLRGVYGSSWLRYRVAGSKLYFAPIPQSSETIRIYYIPLPTTLVGDSDTFNGYNGWEEYVLVDATIRCLNKEESDISSWMAAKKNLVVRIEEAAGNRDAGFSPRITDTRRIEFEQSRDFWY